jgi:hypothetical protein
MAQIDVEEEVVETRVKQATLKQSAADMVSDGDEIWFERADEHRVDASAVMHALHAFGAGHATEVVFPNGCKLTNVPDSRSVRFHYEPEGGGRRAMAASGLRELIEVARGE